MPNYARWPCGSNERANQREAAPRGLYPPVIPRDGHLIQVLCLARISTEHQDERSLDEQEAQCREFLDRNLGQPHQMTVLSGRGSGERLNRAEYLDAIERIRTRRFDLFITEDLGRVTRRIDSFKFCELCIDHKTRLITLNDQIDTAQDKWQHLAGFATLHHLFFNDDASKRSKRSLPQRFPNGGSWRGPYSATLSPMGPGSTPRCASSRPPSRSTRSSSRCWRRARAFRRRPTG